LASVRFEKTGASTYPVNLHLGCYTIPVEKDVILSLKENLSEGPDTFMTLLIEKTTNNSYLHKLIHRELNEVEDIPQQISGLKEFVRNYQKK
jgi:hypothetical protein